MREQKTPACHIHKESERPTAKAVASVVLAVLFGLACLYVISSECLYYFEHPDIKRGDVPFAAPELFLAGKILGWSEE